MRQPHPETWHSHTFRAMGSEIGVWLEASRSEAAAAFTGVENLFAAYEQALSRFRIDSELSQLNTRNGAWVMVSELMWEVLLLALEMALQTDGLFDPTLLPALEQAGYVNSFGLRQPAAPSVARFPGTGQWMQVELDETVRAVRLPFGARLDLGGIAKGYTAQRAVELLRPAGPCLVDAGGDLVAGDAPSGHPGWPVAIGSPGRVDVGVPPDLAVIWLANGSIATSGVDYRRWAVDSRVMHHLIDPATGQPAATDGITVTVVAGRAARAEAWATAALVAGSGKGVLSLLENDLAGLMVTENGRVLVTPAMHRLLQRSRIEMEMT